MTVVAILLTVVGGWCAVSIAVALAFGRAVVIAKRRGPSAPRKRPTRPRVAPAVRHMVAVATGQIPIIRPQAPVA